MSVYSSLEVYPSFYDDEVELADVCPFNFHCDKCEYDCDLSEEEQKELRK